MTKKIFRSIICVSVVTFLACFVFIMGILYDYFNAQLISELKSEAVLTEYGIENYGEDYLKGLKYDNRITWIDSDGSVIYDSDADAASLENHAEREEVAEAFERAADPAKDIPIPLPKEMCIMPS